MPRVVFDTEQGRTCPDCHRPVTDCVCGPASGAPTDGVVRVRREKRRGKIVTVAVGFSDDAAVLKTLVKDLKRSFGTGGTVSAGGFELQGDYRDAVVAQLRQRGFNCVAAGG